MTDVSPVELDPDSLLRATPYSISDGDEAQRRFERIAVKSRATRERAIAATARIAGEAEKVLPQFQVAIRSDLVAESNRMERIDTSPEGVRDLVVAQRELLEAEVGSFLRVIRDDPRLLESLGLYRAYEIADEWAVSATRPREFELRALHALVMPDLRTGGMYKTKPNEIQGSMHTPVAPWEVSQHMSDLADWFVRGSGDAVLDAAVVHAWLAHIHPFDDGNGRMSRLLANLALVQGAYPPLLLRSGPDRGQYLDALSASDDGDILPLFDLFSKSIRRVVLGMEKPNYVASRIRQDLLRSSSQRFDAWKGLTQQLGACIDSKIREGVWSAAPMGYPDLEHFELLERRDSSGNCWWMKLFESGNSRWLLWFGYASDRLINGENVSLRWPSIFVGERVRRPDAVHPYVTDFSDPMGVVEIAVCPGRELPVTLRIGVDERDLSTDDAAERLVGYLCG